MTPPGPNQHLSLVQQNALRLAVVFILFELLATAIVVLLVMMPMAQRSAEDLAGLIVLSAQAWQELPAPAQSEFASELARAHLLVLRPRSIPVGERGDRHGLYIRFLERALDTRLGGPIALQGTWAQGEPWHWALIPVGDQIIEVGFPHRRIGTQPLSALLGSFVVSLLLAIIAAVWLARRIAKPLARFDRATASLGRGETPELLPEDGPRELAHLAHRFNEMAAQVRELLASRTTLLAGISHDLRTPLARMRLALAMLSTRPNSALIARMEVDIEEMDRLIGNLLELAQGLEREPAQPIALRPFLDQLRESAGSERVAVSVEPSDMRILAPALALRRILSNLLDNALRYGGSAKIELVAQIANGTSRIGVLDRGPGIPADQLDAVFRPFHRVEGSRNSATGGTGLGLAIVRQLAKANGWRADLQPRDGGGLEAWLNLSG